GPTVDSAGSAPSPFTRGDDTVRGGIDRPSPLAQRAREEVLQRRQRLKRIAQLAEIDTDRAREGANLPALQSRRQPQRRGAARPARQGILRQEAETRDGVAASQSAHGTPDTVAVANRSATR